MNTKKLLFYSTVSSSLLVTALANNISSGDFETGFTTGWTKHSGEFSSNGTDTRTQTYYSNISYNSASSIVQSGFDSITGVNMVFSGGYAYRLGNSTASDHWYSIYQSFVSDNSLQFAFSPILENGGLGWASDPMFYINVYDQTTSEEIYYHEVLATDLANTVSASNFHYSGWNYVNLNTSARNGHTLRIIANVTGSAQGNYAGYAYLDAFSTSSTIPEPSTYGLIGIGALAVAVVSRRRKKA